MRVERWELRQGGSVDTARSEAVMNGSLIPEMLHLAACGWHVGAAQRDGRAEDPDKAAPPSDRQGVFELSPGEGRRKKFWEAELRVNSICWKTTTATSALPHQGALLKCKACAASALTKKPWLIKGNTHHMRHYSSTITCLNTSQGFYNSA